MVEAPQTPEQHAANGYFASNQVADFSKFSSFAKLNLLQKTPKAFIKNRKVAGVQLPYISHLFAEKALNFVFNFRVSNELVGEPQLTEGKRKDGKTFYECIVNVRFTFVDDAGNEIVRTVTSGHKSYENPATTKADCLKSAMSKAWTVVARTFGIGADIIPQEEKAYASLEKTKVAKPVEPETKKSFDLNTPSY